jgi:hypothetical protein
MCKKGTWGGPRPPLLDQTAVQGLYCHFCRAIPGVIVDRQALSTGEATRERSVPSFGCQSPKAVEGVTCNANKREAVADCEGERLQKKCVESIFCYIVYQPRESINRALLDHAGAQRISTTFAARKNRQTDLRSDQVERRGDRPCGGCSIGMAVTEPCFAGS